MALGFNRMFLGFLAVLADDDFTLDTLYIYLCMFARDSYSAGTVGNNKECSVISTIIHMLVKVCFDGLFRPSSWLKGGLVVKHQNKIS